MIASDAERAAYPEWLQQVERSALEASGRRGKPVGLALSGGGIRSATFCLGVLQALARTDRLQRIDYLSTVSGGGYIGAFLGGLFVRSGRDSKTAPAAVRDRLIGATDRFPIAWLRENGRYLAPNGAGASWLAGAVLLRNWLAVVFVLLVGAWTLVLAADSVQIGFDALGALVKGSRWSPIWGSVAGWWSPVFLLPLLVIGVFAIPPAIAYWLVRVERRSDRGGGAALFGVVAAIGAASAIAGAWALPEVVGEPRVGPMVAAAIVGGLIVAHWASVRGWRPDVDQTARHRLSRALETALVVALGCTAIALADAAGQFLYCHRVALTMTSMGPVGAGVVSVVVSAHRILAMIGSARFGLRAQGAVSAVVSMANGVIAFALLFAAAATLSFASRVAVWNGGGPTEANGAIAMRLAWMLAASAGATGALGRFYRFVNESSLASTYSARLTRAYLGASNARRAAAASHVGESNVDVSRALSGTEPIPGDEIGMDAYHPHLHGGPIHVLNVTINETVDPTIQVKQPDRHGLPLAVGPYALSVGVGHHTRRVAHADAPFAFRAPEEARGDFRVFPAREINPERLGLGDWMAISGAAVAPGLGARTRLGSSLLLGLFNVRLGYWWDSDVDPASRRAAAKPHSWSDALLVAAARAVPVYAFLVGELLARFPGTASRHWYLSDGGHFENTGCYELIRRRLPLIVCCDAGADPAYTFDDLANLVRLARIDFGAEITFLTAEEITRLVADGVRPLFGTLEQLGGRESNAPSEGGARHAAIARIRYLDGASEDGLLLVLKPTVGADEPLDVRNYGATHPRFPQEPTADQFFDDAQWEAYRRLGDHIATSLFAGSSPDEKWHPGAMRGFS